MREKRREAVEILYDLISVLLAVMMGVVVFLMMTHPGNAALFERVLFGFGAMLNVLIGFHFLHHERVRRGYVFLAIAAVAALLIFS